MENDFLKELEFLGLTARLKRLSDSLSASIKELYRTNGIDFEPSWHLVLLFLKYRPAAALSEIASSLKLSQPAMTRMINRMVSAGYLEVRRDETDGRKKGVRLSRMARERLPALQRIWAAGEAAVREMLDEKTVFFQHLEALEDKVRRSSFAERAGKHLRAG